MDHDPNCTCAVSPFASKPRPASRREFLCLAAGTAIGAIGVASSASATTLRGFSPPGETLLRDSSFLKVSDDVRGSDGESQNQTHSSNDTFLTIKLPFSPDMHTHLRQGPAMRVFVERHLASGNDILLAMPNTAPPVNRVTGACTDHSWSIEGYMKMIRDAGGDKLRDLIVPLYLSKETTSEMIDDGAKAGLLRAVKYYPPNVTFNSSSSMSMDRLLETDLLDAMQQNDIVFCIHGEQHGLRPEDYFDDTKNAETIFYQEKMPRLVDKYPKLRISCEHLTTAEAVNFVEGCDNQVIGTVTPQHLLYTVGHLIQTWHADLFCRPLVKFEKDREALRRAVTKSSNRKFTAGTDSAPHPRLVKSTACGCAAGCYVGGIAPQLYAQAFEDSGIDLSLDESQKIFVRFLAENTWRFWRIEPSQDTFDLIKKPSTVGLVTLPDGQQVEPLPVAMMSDNCSAQTATLGWSVTL